MIPGDVLNVRAAPDYRATRVDSLPPGTRDVRTTGRFEQAPHELWVQVEVRAALGWVNRAYLTELSDDHVCDRPETRFLLDTVAAAKTSAALTALASPARPLIVRQFVSSPTPHFERVSILDDSAINELTGALAPGGERACQESNAPAKLSAFSEDWAGLTWASARDSEQSTSSVWIGIELVNQQPQLAALVRVQP